MKIQFILFSLLTISCNNTTKHQSIKQPSIEGTWELISASTIQNDSTHSDKLSGKKMIKIINDTHFAFLNHDINQGKDSLAYFVSGGGKYTLKDNQYTEFLEYCNFREWEGNKFDFTVEIKGDTLIQSGIEKIEELGVDRKIIETYIKLKK